MNIGFFTDTYTPLVDGVVRSILSFRKALEDRGHTVYVFAPDPTRAGVRRYGEIEPPDDDRVFRFSSIDSVFLPAYPVALPVSFKATAKIPKLKLDVVHSHSPVTVGLLADLVAFMANVPKVYTYHTYYSEYSREYILGGQDLTPKMVETYERLYMSRSDAVITPSRKLGKILRDDYKYKGELETIPTGLALSEFEGVTSEDFLLRFPKLRGKRLLLFAGRLGGEKNVSFLIRMMQELQDRDDTVLIIAGTGKDQEQFKQEAAELVAVGRVVFTGLLDRPAMLSAFKAADVFVFASKTDTQALVLSETVAAGTPIVMVDDPGLSPGVEVGKTAIVVPEDERAFASEVRGLLEDDAALASLARGCEELAPQLSMDFTVETLIKTYEHVIEDHQSYSWRSRAREALSRDVDMQRLFPGIGKGRVNLTKAFKNTRKRVDKIRDE